MSVTAWIVDGLVLVLLAISLAKSREKTVAALRVAVNALKRLLPGVLAVIGIIGLILGFVPPNWIARTMGQERGLLGFVFASLLGSILFIPAIIAFPLAGSLMEMGASVLAVSAFITTLTMIGFVFLPLEVREMGGRFALLRNGLSLLAALLVAFLMHLALG
ncbi:MAG: hypothetical protein WHT46_07585 [Candidatus Geothermincolales bacterium]